MVRVEFTEVDRSGRVRETETDTFYSKKAFYEWLHGTERMAPASPDAEPAPGKTNVWHSKSDSLYIALLG